MKKKILLATLAALGAVSVAAALPFLTAERQAPIPVEDLDVDALSARVARQGLSEREAVWERIAWVRDVDEARALAQERDRPIFLFSMWGELDGRC